MKLIRETTPAAFYRPKVLAETKHGNVSVHVSRTTGNVSICVVGESGGYALELSPDEARQLVHELQEKAEA